MKRSSSKWQYCLPEELSPIKVGQTITVKNGHPLAGMVLVITRVDNHAYPICTNYVRFRLDQVVLNNI